MDSAHNPARLSPSDPARSCLKPLGFVDTVTLDEIPEIHSQKMEISTMHEVLIEDLERNYIKLIIEEDFFRLGSCTLEIKIDNLFLRDKLWIVRGELLEFQGQLEQMYDKMKGNALLMDSESCIEVQYSFEKKGYVIIRCNYNGSSDRRIKLSFEMLSTQPQMQETIEILKELL